VLPPVTITFFPATAERESLLTETADMMLSGDLRFAIFDFATLLAAMRRCGAVDVGMAPFKTAAQTSAWPVGLASASRFGPLMWGGYGECGVVAR